MEKRTADIHIRLTEKESMDLKRKANMCGINQSALIRVLLKGYKPREKPDDRFYEVMRQMSAIGNNLNQIAARANTLGLVDATEYKRLAERFNQFQLAVEEEFLCPVKSDLK